MTLYLKNASFIDWCNFDITQMNLAVSPGLSGGIIKSVTIPHENDFNSNDRILDCTGKFVTKSFGCGHHHIYSTLARGMPAPRKVPSNFSEILQYIWWHIDKRLDLDMIQASALASAIHCLKNGVTFVIDHHASPFSISGSLSTIAQAFDQVGIGYMLCYELSDRDGKDVCEEGLAETDNFLASGNQGHVGLHASFTVSSSLLTRAIDLARKHDTGLHIHVAEDAVDQMDSMDKYGRRIIERFDDTGALALEKSIFAHCVHLTENEKQLLKNAKIWVVESVESNQNNNVGIGDYRGLSDNIMLGTDGMHSDMLRSAKAAFLSGQAAEGVGVDSIYKRLRNIHRYLKQCRIQGDDDNNLVILNYDSPTYLTQENFLGHFIYGIDSRHIESVISRGRLVVENGKVVTVDEKDILEHAKVMGRKLWDKM